MATQFRREDERAEDVGGLGSRACIKEAGAHRRIRKRRSLAAFAPETLRKLSGRLVAIVYGLGAPDVSATAACALVGSRRLSGWDAGLSADNG